MVTKPLSTTATLVTAGALAALSVACSGSSGQTARSTPVPTLTSSQTGMGQRCPVTKPRDDTPPGVTPQRSGVNYGNGRLWVSLYPDGRVTVGPQNIAPNGSLVVKFGWWRATRGHLAITGHRLDAPAAPAGAGVPDGYGDQFFQASGVTFPMEGCWEVTGRVEGATLTFVTEVVRGTQPT
jgi:hypothetical protein